MNSFKEFLIYYAVKVFASFVRLLPLSWALALGRVVGWVGYQLDWRHRSQAYANLKTAFGKKMPPRELRRLCRRVFMTYGQNLMELFRLPLMTPELFDRLVTREGVEHVEKALEKGKGVILLAMHFGSWEMANFASQLFSRPYRVLVKPQSRYSRLDDLLNSYRGQSGSLVVERGRGTRDIITSLRQNEIIGMVVDQGGRDGERVSFFGREASLSVGAIRLALKRNVPVCFAVIFRERGGRHRLKIHPPFDFAAFQSETTDLKEPLTPIVRMMEQYIEERPWEYMWFYKIWKYSRQARALILDDGRTGHLRQSQAVARGLSEVLSDRGVRLHVSTVPLRYRFRLAKPFLAGTAATLHPFFWQGRLEWLSLFLEKECWRRLMGERADFFISCGSSGAAINCFLAGENQAKSVVVLRPSGIPFSRFDSVILPAHDVPASKRGRLPSHVTLVRAALNVITPTYLKRQKEKLLRRYSHLKGGHRLRIGLLIGGDTKDFSFHFPSLRQVVYHLKEFCRDSGAEILATTSRRTPEKCESFLVRELKRDPHCSLLILASRQTCEEAVGGILALSDWIVVSGDSLSMVSEASSSGKKCLVFPAWVTDNQARRENKHTRCLESLHAEGYILCAAPQAFRETLDNIYRGKITTRPLDDRETLRQALEKII